MSDSRTVVVIGNFDGVHPGHAEVVRRAHEIGGGRRVVVLTFWPHPASVVRPGGGPKLLTRLPERERLLRGAGADDVQVIEFTRELSQRTPAEFVESHILPLDPAYVVVGENFRFGNRAAGTVETLTELADGRFEVVALPLVHVGDEETCSTGVRAALIEGDVAHAATLLGRPFRFTGIVQHGDHRGRELGFPTANLAVPAELACPADGVYAGWLTRLDSPDPVVWPAAISVGTNPTFDGADRRVEAYVLDRTDLDLYGVEIAVDFVARIRGQVRFDGIEALIVQMTDDVDRTRALLA